MIAPERLRYDAPGPIDEHRARSGAIGRLRNLPVSLPHHARQAVLHRLAPDRFVVARVTITIVGRRRAANGRGRGGEHHRTGIRGR